MVSVHYCIVCRAVCQKQMTSSIHARVKDEWALGEGSDSGLAEAVKQVYCRIMNPFENELLENVEVS